LNLSRASSNLQWTTQLKFSFSKGTIFLPDRKINQLLHRDQNLEFKIAKSFDLKIYFLFAMSREWLSILWSTWNLKPKLNIALKMNRIFPAGVIS
jgi:hypothetical protein